MISKYTLIAASTLAGAAIVPSSFGFAEIARGKLTAEAQILAVYDTNIFANSAEVSDFSGVLIPSLTYTRSVGQISTAVQGGVKAITFQDTNGQDSIDPFLSASFNFDRAEKGSVSQSISYARSTDANDTLNTRTESDEYRGATRVDYFYSEKTGIRLNAGYRMSDYSSSGYNDVWSYNVGGGVLYRYSPKLVASATYSFSPEKATNLGSAPISDPSSKNHRLQVGIEGALAPKLSGSVGVGVVHRDFDVGGSDDTYLLASAISWAAAEKTTVTVSASNDFDTTAGAESAEVLSLALAVRQELTEKLTGGASIGYKHSQLDQLPGPVSRTDDAYLAGVNASYRINSNMSANTAVSYRLNDSTLVLADYERVIVSFGLNLNY